MKVRMGISSTGKVDRGAGSILRDCVTFAALDPDQIVNVREVNLTLVAGL